MKFITLVVSCIILSITLQAQTAPQSPNFAFRFGANSSNYGQTVWGVKLDDLGNTYATGNFNATTNFNPLGTAMNLTAYSNYQDGYLAKYNSSGIAQWVIPFTSQSGSTAVANSNGGISVTTDASGNVYVTGIFWGTVDFDPSPTAVRNLTSNGNSDIFIAKYNSTGQYQWAYSMGGSAADAGTKIVTDNSGNVYLATRFGSSSFETNTTGSGVSKILTAIGPSDIAIIKFNTSGVFQDAITCASVNNNEIVNDVQVDSNDNLFFVGTYSGTLSCGSLSCTAAKFSDAFVLKLNNSLVPQFLFSIGGIYSDEGKNVALDRNNDVIVSGVVQGIAGYNIDMNNSGGSPSNITIVNQGSEAFISKYDNNGVFKWATATQGTGTSRVARPMGLGIDTCNNIVIGGSFTSTFDFDPSGSSGSLTSPSSWGGAVVKFTSLGEYLWGFMLTGYSANFFSFDYNKKINKYSVGGDLITNTTYPNVDVDPTSSIKNLTSFNANFGAALLALYPDPGNVIPTITLGTIANVLPSTSSFTIPFSSTFGSPNQYSISSGTPNAMSSFAAIANSTLPSSPIAVTIPASTANTYNFNFSVRNRGSGCVSANYPIMLTVGGSPTLTATGTLNGFSTCAGTASAEQSFTVGGTNLSNDITVTPPTGYEVSLVSASGYSSSITLTQSGGTVANTTVYTRLASTATGTPSGNITLASTGATTQNVAVSGTVNSLPTITLGSVSSVLTTSTSFSLPYTTTTGSPNEYSITTGTPTTMSGFTAVNNATLPASPISVSIPASAANTYNFNVTLKNSSTGCVSANNPFTVAVLATCPAGTTWTSRTSAADNQWRSVTYGNGLFVAVGSSGTGNRVMTSPDGITWTSRTSAADNSWLSVTYGNGLFVAVGSSGTGNRVMTSPDGITWTIRSSAANNIWNSVTYGNGLFVAVGSSGTGNRVMTSPNGINWTSRTSAADNSWLSVTYGNGLFVAVSYDGTGNSVMTSPDGITWTIRSSAADNSWYSVTYGNGVFVTVAGSGNGNRVMTSPDGITWTSRTSAADITWRSVTYGNGVFVAVAIDGTGNRVMTSPDGITWSIRTSAADNSWYSVTYGNGVFVAVAVTGTGNRVMTSTPQLVTPMVTIVANPGNSITTGTSVTFTATPTNGGTTPAYQWKKNNNNVGTNSVTYTDAALENGDIITCVLTSNNPCASPVTATSMGITMAVSYPCPAGTTWTSRTSAADNQWRSVTYGNGLFVAVGSSGTGNRVMTSPDGITWTSRTSAADNSWYSVTYGNGLFVAVAASGTGNRVMTSPDGITWTSRTSAANNNWFSVTYGNGLFVAVSSTGTGNRVMTSPDGINWTSRTSAENSWISVTYGNGLFVAVSLDGLGNRVMTSPDGITWTSRTSAADNGWISVTYGNGVFVAVAYSGTGNRVMTSPDGINWTIRTSAADNQWYSVTYGNGVFVAVAYNGTGNRVMTSPDGITWTIQTSAADNSWYSVTYGNGVFVAVAVTGTGNRVMTSTPQLVTPFVTIAANPSNSITTGTSVTFTATPTNGGTTPAYQWKKNNNNVGTNSVTYTDAALENGDIITCVLTSNNPCASPVTATSTGITMAVAAVPIITTTGTLTVFTSCSGIVSSQQSFTVSGTSLTANLVVTAPAGFEVSTTTGSGYSSSVSLTPISGTVANTPIFVRLASTATGTPSGNITLASTGATTQNVAVSGTVNSLPTITLGSVSSVLTTSTSFSLPYTTTTGSPNEYSITTGTPTTMSGFTAVNNATLPASPISVAIPASAANTYNFNVTLTNSTTGCVSATVPFTVTVAAPVSAVITTTFAFHAFSTCSPTVSAAQSFTVGGTNLSNDITIIAPTGFELSLTSASGYTSSITLTQSGGTVANTTVYTRLASTATGTPSGNITVVSTGASAQNVPVSGTVNPRPTISLGTINSVSTTATSFSLPYIATTGSPDKYTLLAGSPVSMSGFTQVNNALLPASPINVTIPASAANTYDFYLLATNSSTGCISFTKPFKLTVVAPASATVTATGTLNGFSTCSGSASTEQSFTVEGTNLSNDITVTAPTGYEVSLASASGYTSSITLTQSGGTVASTTVYTRLANTATGTPSGNITVVSTGASAQNVPVSGTVNPLSTATISAGSAITFCQGGSVTLTASTGTNYLWSTGATTASINVSTSGNYTVTVTNANGCSATSTATTVTVNPLPTATISAGSATTFCQGGSVTLTASTGTNYLWSTGATTASINASTSGNYTVTVTNANGCSATSTATTVTVNPLLTATISAGSVTTFCHGGSVTLTASTGTNYLWSTGATTASINASTSGNYTVTVTNVNGCSATSTATTVTVNPLPTATISAGSTTTFCQGGSVTLTASTGTSYLWSTGATTASINASTSGNYIVTVTNVNGCSATSTATTVTVNPLPTATISAGSTTTFCQGGSVTLTASTGTNYLWSTGATTASINVSTSGNYTVTVTNANGCSATSTATTVTVNPLPTATIIAGSATTFCQGGSVTLTASTGTSYLWSTGATTASINVSTSGNYTVTVTNANGCSATSTATTVTVNPLPTATISAGSATTFCQGGSVTLTASTGTSYLWSTGATTASINASTSGNYTVRVTNASGCSATSTATTVTVNPLPTASIAGTTAICQNATAPNITFTGAAGTAPYTFSYTINGGTTQTVTTTTGSSVTVAAPTTTAGTYTYTLVSVKDASATTCSNTATGTATVTVNSLPTATISGTTAICQNATAPTITFTGAGATAPYTFSYIINGGATQSVTTTNGSSVMVSVPTTTAGTYAYALVSVKDASATTCSNTAIGTATVTVNPLPTATISGTTAICQNATAPNITFTGAAGTAPYTFSYTINGGATQSVTTTNGSSVMVSVPTTTAGTYAYALVSVKDASATTCSNTAIGTATVTVNPLPTATISGTTAICQNATAPNITFTGAAGTAPYTFSYTINGGATQTVTTTTGSSVTVAAPTGTAGTYTYTLVSVQDASSTACTKAATANATVTVNPLPTASISAASTVICGAGNTTNLIAVGGATYQWFRNGTLISGATSSPYAAATIGTYSATAISSFGCTAPANGSLVVTQLFAPKASFSYDTYCTNKAINFTNTSTVNTTGSVSYTWSDNNGNSSNATNARFTYANAGSYPVKLKVQSSTCNNLADSIIQVLPVEAPRAAIRQVTLDVAINDNVQLQARNFGNQYTWSPSLGLSNPFISNPIINTTKEQEYLITIGVPSGCATVDTLKVRVQESNKIYVPNVFSPNGDGQNDKLYVIPVGITELKFFRIFNRWGKKLFETSTLSQGWDGTFNGQLQPLETYVWTVWAVDKDGKNFYQEGSVTLLR